MPNRPKREIRGTERFYCGDRAAVWVHHHSHGTRISYHEPPGGEPLYSEGMPSLRWFRHGFDERGIFLGNFVKRARETLKKNGQANYPDDAGFSEQYPALWDFMTTDRWDDGKARQRSTLTIFCEGGAFKASLNDRDGKCSGFTTAATFSDVLGALEEALQNETIDWRAWQGFKKKGGG